MKCTGFPLIIQFYLKKKTFEEKLKRLSNESLRPLGLKVLLIINGISINHNKSDPNLMIRMANQEAIASISCMWKESGNKDN